MDLSFRQNVIVLILAATAAGCASARVREQDIRALMDSGGVPGLSVAIVSDKGVQWSRGFGVARTGGSEVDANTVFEAASLSKTVTAYTALRLVDKGVLSLDVPMSSYLTYADLPDDPRAKRITARMVLSHTTGLQNERIGDERLALQFDPGTAFRYSGEGYLYLAKVLEQVTGLPFNDVVSREVFEPLGMTRSSYVWRSQFDANAAVGHNFYGDALKPTRPAFARASTLQTTAHDYGIFLHAVMTGRGLSESTRHQMIMSQVRAADSVAWGLGWSLEHTPAGIAAWHHGDNSNTGFTAFTWWRPDMARGIVYFANSTTGLGITSRLLDLIGQPFNGAHPALRWIAYEQYNAPSRHARLALEKKMREEGVAAALRRYEELKRSKPEAVSEGLLNSLGYRFMSLGRTNDAIELFKRNVEAYPRSSNVYDSLGEAYAAAGERELALENYRRSLELDPANANAVAMVRRLSSSK